MDLPICPEVNAPAALEAGRLVVAAASRLHKPGCPAGVQHARRETEQEEENEAPRRSTEKPVSPISKSGADRKPRDELGRDAHGEAERLAAPVAGGRRRGA